VKCNNYFKNRHHNF